EAVVERGPVGLDRGQPWLDDPPHGRARISLFELFERVPDEVLEQVRLSLQLDPAFEAGEHEHVLDQPLEALALPENLCQRLLPVLLPALVALRPQRLRLCPDL